MLFQLFKLFLINGQRLWPLRELVWIALYLLFSFYQVVFVFWGVDGACCVDFFVILRA